MWRSACQHRSEQSGNLGEEIEKNDGATLTLRSAAQSLHSTRNSQRLYFRVTSLINFLERKVRPGPSRTVCFFLTLRWWSLRCSVQPKKNCTHSIINNKTVHCFLLVTFTLQQALPFLHTAFEFDIQSPPSK